jgi:formate-dependent nitrite reductase cytochrome c552 subunit
MRTAEQDRKIGVVDVAASRPPFSIKDVAYVLGNMRKLLFLKKGDNGLVVVPHQYNLSAASWEPLNVEQWDHLFGSGADRTPAKADLLSWNDRCAGCHTTGYDPNARTFAEASIACESCHGPGARHAASKKRDDIVNPAALRGEKANHVCGQCHARGNDTSGKYPYPVGFKPGNDLSDYFVLAQPIKGDNSDLFWGNGMARKHHAQYNEFIQSKHFQNGLHCFECHEVHAFRPVPSSPETRLMAQTERFLLKTRARFICFKCHTSRETEFSAEERAAGGKIVDQHTHHPPVITETVHDGKAVSEPRMQLKKMHCGDCHMPREETGAASYDIRAHTFKIPSPTDTIAYGAPNACNDCHSRESAKWAEQWIINWRRERTKAPK